MSQIHGTIESMLRMQKQATQPFIKDELPKGEGALSIAFKKSGYRLREKKISWPRSKGPAGLRVEVGTGHLVGTVVKLGRRELTVDYLS